MMLNFHNTCDYVIRPGQDRDRFDYFRADASSMFSAADYPVAYEGNPDFGAGPLELSVSLGGEDVITMTCLTDGDGPGDEESWSRYMEAHRELVLPLQEYYNSIGNEEDPEAPAFTHLVLPDDEDYMPIAGHFLYPDIDGDNYASAVFISEQFASIVKRQRSGLLLPEDNINLGEIIKQPELVLAKDSFALFALSAISTLIDVPNLEKCRQAAQTTEESVVVVSRSGSLLKAAVEPQIGDRDEVIVWNSALNDPTEES